MIFVLHYHCFLKTVVVDPLCRAPAIDGIRVTEALEMVYSGQK